MAPRSSVATLAEPRPIPERLRASTRLSLSLSLEQRALVARVAFFSFERARARLTRALRFGLPRREKETKSLKSESPILNLASKSQRMPRSSHARANGCTRDTKEERHRKTREKGRRPPRQPPRSARPPSPSSKSPSPSPSPLPPSPTTTTTTTTMMMSPSQARLRGAFMPAAVFTRPPRISCMIWIRNTRRRTCPRRREQYSRT